MVEEMNKELCTELKPEELGAGEPGPECEDGVCSPYCGCNGGNCNINCSTYKP